MKLKVKGNTVKRSTTAYSWICWARYCHFCCVLGGTKPRDTTWGAPARPQANKAQALPPIHHLPTVQTVLWSTTVHMALTDLRVISHSFSLPIQPTCRTDELTRLCPCPMLIPSTAPAYSSGRRHTTYFVAGTAPLRL